MARKRSDVARTFLAVFLVYLAVGLSGARPSRPGLSSWILQEPFRSIAVDSYLQSNRRHATTSAQHRTSSQPSSSSPQDNNNLIPPQLPDTNNNNNNKENFPTPADYYSNPGIPLSQQLDTDDVTIDGKSSSMADRRPNELLPVRQKAAPGLNADVFYVSRGRRRTGGSQAARSASLHTGGVTSVSSRSTARRPQLQAAAAALLGFGGRDLERLAGRGRTELGQPETDSDASWMLAGIDSRDQYRSLKVKRQPPPGFHAIRGKRRSHGRYQESGLPKD